MMKLNFKLMYLLGLAITFSFVSCSDDDDTSDQNLVLASSSDVAGVWNLSRFSIIEGVKEAIEFGVDTITATATDSIGFGTFGYTISAEDTGFVLDLQSDGLVVETSNDFSIGTNLTINSTTLNSFDFLETPTGINFTNTIESTEVVENLFFDSSITAEDATWSLVDNNSIIFSAPIVNEVIATEEAEPVSTITEILSTEAEILFVGELAGAQVLRLQYPLTGNSPFFAEEILTALQEISSEEDDEGNIDRASLQGNNVKPTGSVILTLTRTSE